MKNINQTEFIALSQKEDYIILDVRRPDECATGIIENATMIDFMDNEKFVTECQKLDPTKHYLIYCRSGNRSGKACMQLDGLGFQNTYNLMGGMLDWTGNVCTPTL